MKRRRLEVGEESVREELERITRKYDDLVKKLRDKVGHIDTDADTVTR